MAAVALDAALETVLRDCAGGQQSGRLMTAAGSLRCSTGCEEFYIAMTIDRFSK
jgi:hypothetical protein